MTSRSSRRAVEVEAVEEPTVEVEAVEEPTVEVEAVEEPTVEVEAVEEAPVVEEPTVVVTPNSPLPKQQAAAPEGKDVLGIDGKNPVTPNNPPAKAQK